MTNELRRSVLQLVGIALLLLLPMAGRTGDAADQQLAQVLAAWERRQGWFQSVRYDVRGEHRVPKAAYSDALGGLPKQAGGLPVGVVSPSQELSAMVSFSLLLDFAKGRHYREVHDQLLDLATGQFSPSETKDVFDGSKDKLLIPRDGNPKNKALGVTQPEMTIVSGNMKNCAFLGKYFPVFFGHGRIYTAMQPILPGQLLSKPDPKYLHSHGMAVHDGRACLVIRTQTLQMMTTSFDEFWVDNTRDGAIVRYICYSGKDPYEETRIDYRMVSSKWLPHGWRWTVYRKGKPLYFEDLSVEKIRLDPAITDADFDLDMKPGMLVEERTDLATPDPIAFPKSKISVYRPKKDGKREAIRDPYHRQGDQYIPPPPPQPGRWRASFALAFVAAGVGAVAAWCYRRRFKK